MTSTTEKKQPQPQKNKFASRWMLVFLLVPLMLVAAWGTQAFNPSAPINGNLLDVPSLTPSATATTTNNAAAVSTSKPTATENAAPSSPPVAKATVASTSTPTATQNATSSSTGITTVLISRELVYLRTGPGTNYPVARQFTLGEELILLGRLNNNSWLYVKTSDGEEGWVIKSMVDLTEITLENHPIETPSPIPETTVTIVGGTVYLRTGPNANFTKIQALAYGDALILLGRLSDNNWLYVKTPAGQEGWIQTSWVDLSEVNFDSDYIPVHTSPPTETSTPVIVPGIEGRWIDVDLGEQMLYAYEGTELKASFLVSTGLDLYPTERGQYRIYVKMPFSDMRGNDYYLPDVPFTMYYSGDFSIHGTYWHHNFGTQMSHGCINMDTQEAEWIYNFVSVGTLVNIHR